MAQKDLLELVDGLLGRGQPALSASALQLAGQLLRWVQHNLLELRINLLTCDRQPGSRNRKVF